jgi:hypothetical protein
MNGLLVPSCAGADEMPESGSRALEWCMGLVLSCDWFVRVGRVGVNY